LAKSSSLVSPPGAKEHQNLTRKLGADRVAIVEGTPPEKLGSAIDFTSAWQRIVEALRI